MIPRAIPSGRLLAFDTETTGLFTYKGARPFYFAFCNPEGEVGRFRWEVDRFTRRVKPNSHDYAALQGWFGNPKNTFICHNSKFDIGMLRASGIDIKAQTQDTFFAAHTLRNNEMDLRLKPLCRKYLGFPDDDEKALDKAVAAARRQGKKFGWMLATEEREGGKPVKADMWMVSDEWLDPYGIGDVERCMLLWKVLAEELEKDPVSKRFYLRELELQPITMEMEARGVRIRRDVVKKEIVALKLKVQEAEKILRREIGENFNPNSPQQVAAYVYGKLGIPVQFYTKTGRPSTNLEALRQMDHPNVRALQQYNSYNDAVNNFFQKYLNLMVEHEDGYWLLHPDFNQVGPSTGRYSCRNPNMQNAPNAVTSRNPYPIQARGPFCPRPGYTWWSYDFSGEEAWIFANGANEKEMLRALLAALDPHSEAADFVWGKGTVAREAAMGSKVSRGRAKMFFFGTIYGQQDYGASRTLGVPKHEAKRIRARYYNKFPRIPEFMDEVVATVQELGYITTAWGRKIFVDPGYEYKATNYHVQGTGADHIKDGMLRVHRYLRKNGIDGHLVLTIHDEVVIEIADREVNRGMLEAIRDILEDHQGYLKLIPKLPADIARIKKSWDTKEEKYDLMKVPAQCQRITG